jgi:hypothetical protein
MRKATYSFGEESPIKFEIPDKMAQRFNEAADQFFKAQQRFNQRFGRTWNPHKDPFELSWTKKQRRAWDQFARVYKDVLAEYGPYHENDLMDDFLVKNTISSSTERATSGIGGELTGLAEIVLVPMNGWGRILSLAVTSGALYGYLRGL